MTAPFEPMAWAYLTLNLDGVDTRATQIRGVLDQLTAASAPAPVIAAIGERLRRAPVAPTTLAVFADADGTVVHEQQVEEEHGSDRAGFSVPADVFALLADDQRRPPYVFVAVDRAGADLMYSRGGVAADHRATIDGVDDEIRRTASGGWAGLSQSRFQRRAEDSWKHNAYQFADRVAAVAAEVGAQGIIVAGEPHVLHYLREHLPEPVAELVQHIPGSRAAQRPERVQLAKVRAALQQVEAIQTAQLLAHLHEHDDGDAAVQGVKDTIAALAAGRVGLLLVDPTIALAPTWFGGGPTAVFPNHAYASRHRHPVEVAPLAHVAVRSALLSGAQVRVLSPGTTGAPADGIGALCRFRLGERSGPE